MHRARRPSGVREAKWSRSKRSISKSKPASSSDCSAPTAPGRRRPSASSPRACCRRRGTAIVAGADVVARSRRSCASASASCRSGRIRTAALNVRENLRLSRRVLRHRARDRDAARRELLAKLGIADKSEAKVGQLSGGQQQRLDDRARAHPRAARDLSRRADGRARSAGATRPVGRSCASSTRRAARSS